MGPLWSMQTSEVVEVEEVSEICSALTARQGECETVWCPENCRKHSVVHPRL